MKINRVRQFLLWTSVFEALAMLVFGFAIRSSTELGCAVSPPNWAPAVAFVAATVEAMQAAFILLGGL